ncbi:hypothetical protein BT93_C0414 [Corymbia citriodora subsp. variegata]|nr:hypothetical protein BT93_C0414 [Corymbia citriodora subsp. variegata]KAF8034131.1 hypothetical protein BT93_C0414 [Corymbia citriodora subsp. variegata]
MALAPFPPPIRSCPSTRTLTPSPPLQLLLLRRSSSGALWFRARCSHRSVQFEAQPTRVPFDAGRKKRKPKPSFFEQIRGKWTSKTDSVRERFPWQVEERKPPRGQCEDERLVSREVSGKAVETSLEHERKVDSPATDGVAVRAFSVNQSTLPPWAVHGCKPSPEPIRDDGRGASRLGSGGEEIEEVRERLDDDDVVRAGKSISKVDFGGEFDTEDDEWEKLSAVAGQGENLSLTSGGLIASDVLSDDDHHQVNVELEKLDVSGENGSKVSVDLPWKREGDGRRKHVDLAERMLPQHELRRLRKIALRMVERTKVGDAGITQSLVDSIHQKWTVDEVVKLKFEGPQSLNMKRTHEALENLTGGTLLSRNKDYIVFYRGNDFLPPVVVEALKEREKLTDVQANEEDQARQRASAAIESKLKASKRPLVAGTLTETLAATSRWGNEISSKDVEQMRRAESLNKHASLLKYLEQKLALAKGKVKRAEKALAKVQENLRPVDLPVDPETITDEERSLLRKIGLSMKPFLLIGRRGIFDGTIENMHLHWKYRELVKLIVRGKSFAQVKHLAVSLEAESGGVLVSLDKTMKGYAIIIYRGKNYQRPQAVRPRNLLTRRQALARSIELQRREALKHHISDLQERIELLKYELEDMRINNQIDEEKLSRSFNAGATIDDTSEDEGEEAYLGVYDSGVEDT